MTSRATKFRQAALVYIGLGILVIILTLVAGTSPERGTPPLIGLFIGAGFVAVFGVMIYAYGWVTQPWVQRTIAVFTGVLVVTNTLRALQYFINFLGYRLEINFRTFGLAVHPSEFSLPYVFLLCAFLMGFITFMLARAAWDL